jgi:hypothetical protein
MEPKEQDLMVRAKETMEGASDILRALAWHGDVSADAIRLVADALESRAEEIAAMVG